MVNTTILSALVSVCSLLLACNDSSGYSLLDFESSKFDCSNLENLGLWKVRDFRNDILDIILLLYGVPERKGYLLLKF